MQSTHYRLTCVAALLASVAATGVHADPALEYVVGVQIRHDDNINLSQDDPISQDTLSPTFGFTFNETGSTVQAVAAGAVEYDDYLGNEFGDRALGNLAARVNWTLSPERLSLVVEDYLGVEPVNVLEPNTPTNLQQTNVLSVGPTLRFRLGDAMRGEADLRFIDSYASKNDEFNSQRGLAAVRAIRDTSQTSSLSGNFEAQRVTFDNTSPTEPDYTRYDAFARYQSKLAHFDLDASLGYSHIALDGGLPDEDSPLVRALVSWRASPQSTFTAEISRQLTDVAQDILTDPRLIGTTIPTVSPGSSVVGSQLYLERRAATSYAYLDQLWSFNVAAFYQKLHYQTDSTQDQSGPGASLDAAYRLRESLSIGAHYDEETRRYETIDRTDEDFEYGLYMAGRWTPKWGWRVDLGRHERKSTVEGSGYTDNFEMFTVSYSR